MVVNRSPYDRIVSLGGSCEVTWNIHNHFGVSCAYPFDWWVTPGNSLIRALADNMRDMYSIDNLVLINDSVMCRKYQILHHHDFPRDEEHRVIPSLGSHIDELKQKFDFIWKRFLSDLASGRTLFVRAECSYSNVNNWIPYPSWGGELLHTLRHKFPLADIDLLLVCEHERGEVDGVIYDKPEQIGDGGDWKGWPDGWREMYDRLGIKLKLSSD